MTWFYLKPFVVKAQKVANALKSGQRRKSARIHYKVHFYKPKTKITRRAPKVINKVVEKLSKMDQYRVLKYPLTTESAMKKVFLISSSFVVKNINNNNYDDIKNGRWRIITPWCLSVMFNLTRGKSRELLSKDMRLRFGFSIFILFGLLLITHLSLSFYHLCLSLSHHYFHLKHKHRSRRWTLSFVLMEKRRLMSNSRFEIWMKFDFDFSISPLSLFVVVILIISFIHLPHLSSYLIFLSL